ncbi:MAG: DUF6282 family protein [Candidatus Bathyarchaeia archaeon]
MCLMLLECTFEKNISGIDAFGGIVLNPHVGGLNPYAVETCLRFWGQVV